MAARAGFEPATKWLTATCSTAELPSNFSYYQGIGINNSITLDFLPVKDTEEHQ